MSNYSLAMSEDLLNHFVGKLMEGVEEIERLWLELEDESFSLNIHGHRYVDYAISARFEVAEVDYSPRYQTVVFRQIGPTELRGRFPFGKYLSKLVDEPLKDYLCDFEFVEYRDGEYIFDLRRSESMRSFFDLELTGDRLTVLFPFSDLKVTSDEIKLVG